jgi:uncharacterized protein YbjT (DUF2867 family)
MQQHAHSLVGERQSPQAEPLCAVIGAAGRSGRALVRALAGAGNRVLAVQRTPAASDPAVRVADLADPSALRAALEGATVVVNTAHARWTPQVLAAAPPGANLVLMGSTRRFSRWPDPHGDGVRAGEAAFLASGRPGVMLHPTLIYGREGEGDVQRLAALLARLPLAPLPGGGRALVQPIYQDDVTRCLLAALLKAWERPETMVVAGPEAMEYRDFLRMVAQAAGLRAPPVIGFPAALLRPLATLSALLPGRPRVTPAQIRRLTEDKAFDIGAMRRRLGIEPIPLRDGLALTFPQPASP